MPASDRRPGRDGGDDTGSGADPPDADGSLRRWLAAPGVRYGLVYPAPLAAAPALLSGPARDAFGNAVLAVSLAAGIAWTAVGLAEGDRTRRSKAAARDLLAGRDSPAARRAGRGLAAASALLALASGVAVFGWLGLLAVFGA